MDIFLIQSKKIFHKNICLLTVFVRNVSNLKRDGFLWGFMCRSVLGLELFLDVISKEDTLSSVE